jgi:hypothetical protein
MHRNILPNHFRFSRAAFHVHRHALAKLYFLQIRFVAAIRALRPATGIGVVVKHSGHAGFGEQTKIFNAGDGCHGASLVFIHPLFSLIAKILLHGFLRTPNPKIPAAQKLLFFERISQKNGRIVFHNAPEALRGEKLN